MTAQYGALSVADPFDDRMVLQRGMPVPIWGQATPGAEVAVRFAGQTVSTVAAADGSWRIILDPMPASGEDRQLTVTSRGESVTLDEVLVGDVWLTSGQSNMERSFYADPALAAQAGATDDPLLRLRVVHRRVADAPLHSIDGSPWLRCNAEALRAADNKGAAGDLPPGFSAVSFAFGRRIRAELGVPVGLVSASWGGTRVEAWTPPGATPVVPTVEHLDEQQQPVPCQQVSALYFGMLTPWVGYALSGALWYQGETNVLQGDGARYTDRQVALVSGWRDAWRQGDFPFYFVQLAPFIYENSLPEFWDAQVRSIAAIGNSGMAATQDIGDWNDIHPLAKGPVGERLARLALSRHYRVTIVDDSGPQFAGARRVGSAVHCWFESAESGLSTSDGNAPAGFELAGADGEFIAAHAEVVGTEIVVSSPAVSDPAKVRFGWVSGHDTNVMNGVGLPMIAFAAQVG